MKIWVTGISGLLGKHIKEEFEKIKIPFIGTTKNEVDITNLEAVLSFLKRSNISHIVNAAAYTAVDLAEDHLDLAFFGNVVGPKYLAMASKIYKIPLLHFSTDYLFNGEKNAPYSEEDLPSPLNVYGKTKWEGELEIQKETSQFCIIRTSWLFGKYEKNFVKTMLKLMKEKKEILVVDDQIGKPTFAKDLAEALPLFLNKTGVFHFANQGEASWYRFAVEIFLQAKKNRIDLSSEAIYPISSKDYVTAAKRSRYSSLDTKKIESILDYYPRPWQKALEELMTNF